MTEKNLGGRPKIILTDKQIAQVEALAAYLPIIKICNHMGFSETAFYELRCRDVTVYEAYNRGVAKGEAFAGSSLMQFMSYESETPNMAQLQMKLQAVTFYLRMKAGWSEKQLIETKDTTPQKRFVLEADSGTAQD